MNIDGRRRVPIRVGGCDGHAEVTSEWSAWEIIRGGAGWCRRLMSEESARGCPGAVAAAAATECSGVARGAGGGRCCRGDDRSLLLAPRASPPRDSDTSAVPTAQGRHLNTRTQVCLLLTSTCYVYCEAMEDGHRLFPLVSVAVWPEIAGGPLHRRRPRVGMVCWERLRSAMTLHVCQTILVSHRFCGFINVTLFIICRAVGTYGEVTGRAWRSAPYRKDRRVERARDERWRRRERPTSGFALCLCSALATSRRSIYLVNIRVLPRYLGIYSPMLFN